MIPGMNPRQAKQIMKKMGISQQDIDAEQVIIKTAEKDIIILNPSVAKVNMMGQETFQISGEVHEQAKVSEDATLEISDEDIETVCKQTNASKEEAKRAIEENKGDLAAAIMQLTKE